MKRLNFWVLVWKNNCIDFENWHRENCLLEFIFGVEKLYILLLFMPFKVIQNWNRKNELLELEKCRGYMIDREFVSNLNGKIKLFIIIRKVQDLYIWSIENLFMSVIDLFVLTFDYFLNRWL